MNYFQKRLMGLLIFEPKSKDGTDKTAADASFESCTLRLKLNSLIDVPTGYITMNIGREQWYN